MPDINTIIVLLAGANFVLTAFLVMWLAIKLQKLTQIVRE